MLDLLRSNVHTNTTARALKEMSDQFSLEGALQNDIAFFRVHGINRENLVDDGVD